jgi:ubiquinol-cytochrome c reductase cytochrome c1 subunit
MTKIILFFFIAMSSCSLYAKDIELLPLTPNLKDAASLQRGAKLFMNYCSGCHSLRYMRYSRMAKDLGLTTFAGEPDSDLLKNNLIFTKAMIHDPIVNSMPPADARQWFGRVPPDLSLSARERGSAWIYTYLKSFYADKKRPFGANNLLVPDVGMPNVLAPLVGKVILRHNQQKSEATPPTQLLLVTPGEMSQGEFDQALQDLVTFLVYVSEPTQMIRYKIGWAVLSFLCVFLLVAYQLKKNYWLNIN